MGGEDDDVKVVAAQQRLHPLRVIVRVADFHPTQDGQSLGAISCPAGSHGVEIAGEVRPEASGGLSLDVFGKGDLSEAEGQRLRAHGVGRVVTVGAEGRVGISVTGNYHRYYSTPLDAGWFIISSMAGAG